MTVIYDEQGTPVQILRFGLNPTQLIELLEENTGFRA